MAHEKMNICKIQLLCFETYNQEENHKEFTRSTTQGASCLMQACLNVQQPYEHQTHVENEI
jgi:hypothetical protein